MAYGLGMTDASGAPAELAAGRAALSRGAWLEARRRFEHVLAAEETPDALEGLSWAAWWLEDVGGCLDARERAYRRYREIGDARGAARMALWLGDDHVEFRGAHAVAGGWFRRAARILDTLPDCPEHGWLAVFEAHAALERHDLDEAVGLAGRARQCGRCHGAVDLEMFALASEGVIRIERGDVAGGMRSLDEAAAAALSGEYENLASAAWTCCLLMSSCERVRDIDRGAQWCEQIGEYSRRMDAAFLRGVCRAHYGAIQVWKGSWDEAELELVEALGELSANRPNWRSEALVRLGHLRHAQGRHADAQGLFEQAAEHPLALQGMAALRLDDHDPKAARDLLERAMRHSPHRTGAGQAQALEMLLRADLELGDTGSARLRLEELRAAATAAGTAALSAMVEVCEGLVAASDGQHARACGHFEDAVDRFARTGAPVEAARARLQLAASLLALDRREAAEREIRLAHSDLTGIDAVAEREQARRLLERLGADGRASAGRGATLTDRQLEVLALVAEGLSDQQIAARLVLSHHTVHRHIANIYTRLDCSSRAAAVAAASRMGLL